MWATGKTFEVILHRVVVDSLPLTERYWSKWTSTADGSIVEYWYSIKITVNWAPTRIFGQENKKSTTCVRHLLRCCCGYDKIVSHWLNTLFLFWKVAKVLSHAIQRRHKTSPQLVLWKANEFRWFLFYLPVHCMKHCRLACTHISPTCQLAHIMCSDNFLQLLQHQTCVTDESQLVHLMKSTRLFNVYNWTRLAEFVNYFGVLDTFLTFPFGLVMRVIPCIITPKTC